VNVDFLIVIYLIVTYLQKSRFCFSDYLVAKDPVIYRLVGTRLVREGRVSIFGGKGSR
jgi:hypothetical protein